MKAYLVDFKYTIESEASTSIAAKNEEEAAEGAKFMLTAMGEPYASAEIVKVEEFKRPTETPQPTLN